MYVSITALKAKGFFSAIRFWLLAVPVFKQAISSAGILFCDARSVDGFHYTLIAWKTKKDMRKFVLSATHRKVMKIFLKIASDSTIDYETDRVPRWGKALLKWKESAVNYN
tara:strand:- start:273 stop:605 length:333 start_codon:yes stop_codon:yes gene_type:complete